jgi:hypothetical protein
MAASSWGSNNWGEQAWGDNAVVVGFDTWGNSAWGEGNWGEGANTPTLSSNVGSVNISIGVAVNVTGQSLNSAIGSVTTSANADIDVNGNVLTSNIGQIDFDADSIVTLTGIVLTSTIGAVDLDADGNITINATENSINYKRRTSFRINRSRSCCNNSWFINNCNKFSINVTADANVTETGLSLTSSIGDRNSRFKYTCRYYRYFINF